MTDVFPGVGNDGCFFHLSKQLDCHVKQLGLTVQYTGNVAFRIRVKCLAALAFLPVTDVITFLNDELPLLSYFETTWIGQPAGGRRLAPTFPHQMWNVSDRASTVPRPGPPGQQTHSRRFITPSTHLYPANTLPCGSYS